jgi:ribosomal protein L29
MLPDHYREMPVEDVQARLDELRAKLGRRAM